MTAIVANYYLLPGFLILCVLFLGIRWYYIRTARDIKRLEALGILLSSCSTTLVQFTIEARSPIYSQLSLTLQGLATIRSYSMQSVMIERLYQYQNQHTQAWYLFQVSTGLVAFLTLVTLQLLQVVLFTS